jgi:hypothetical protein
MKHKILIEECPDFDQSLLPSHFPAIPEVVDVIVFHAPCADGTAAAYAVGARFQNALLVGVNRGLSEKFLSLPPSVHGSHVVLVDYVYPELLMEELLAVAASVTVVDHHPSELPLMDHFARLFPEKFNYIYAENVSAAALAWRWLHADLPLLYHYIDDNDTGRWKLANVGHFMAGLNVDAPVFSADVFSFDDFWIFKSALAGGADYVRSRVVLGMIARMTERRDIRQLAQRCAERRLPAAPEFSCRVVNSSDLSGPLHRALLSGSFDDARGPCDISMQYYFIDATGGWKISLRSAQDSHVDVGEIARFYGGGGHKHAASFLWDDDLDLVFDSSGANSEKNPRSTDSPESDEANWETKPRSTDSPESEWRPEREDYSELDRGWTFSWTKWWYRQDTG